VFIDIFLQMNLTKSVWIIHPLEALSTTRIARSWKVFTRIAFLALILARTMKWSISYHNRNWFFDSICYYISRDQPRSITLNIYMKRFQISFTYHTGMFESHCFLEVNCMRISWLINGIIQSDSLNTYSGLK
jgi:hypothetical protein